MKWFYHAAETEGTAQGGGRVEDIHMPVRDSCSSDRSDSTNCSDSNSRVIKSSNDSINSRVKDINTPVRKGGEAGVFSPFKTDKSNEIYGVLI